MQLEGRLEMLTVTTADSQLTQEDGDFSPPTISNWTLPTTSADLEEDPEGQTRRQPGQYLDFRPVIPQAEDTATLCLDFWPAKTASQYIRVVLSHHIFGNFLYNDRKLICFPTLPSPSQLLTISWVDPFGARSLAIRSQAWYLTANVKKHLLLSPSLCPSVSIKIFSKVSQKVQNHFHHLT